MDNIFFDELPSMYYYSMEQLVKQLMDLDKQDSYYVKYEMINDNGKISFRKESSDPKRFNQLTDNDKQRIEREHKAKQLKKQELKKKIIELQNQLKQLEE